MPDFNPNRVMHGNGGTAWWNGKKLTTLQSVEAKVTGDFEDINVCGDPATYRIYNGYSGEGTLVWLKIDSDVLVQMAEAFRTGIMPEITVITAQTQLSAAGYTPYEGFKTRGSIAQVYLRGTLAVDHGEMKTGPIGTYIPRHPGSL